MVAVPVEDPPLAATAVAVAVVVEVEHIQEELETHQHQQIQRKELMEGLDIIVIHM